MEQQMTRRYFPASPNDGSHYVVHDGEDCDADYDARCSGGHGDCCVEADYGVAVVDLDVAVVDLDAVVDSDADADVNYNPMDHEASHRVLFHALNTAVSKILHQFDFHIVQLAT